MKRLCSLKPDIAFNICESIFTRSEDEMKMAAILDVTGFPYTGSGPIALGLAQDKGLSKSLLQQGDVQTPKFCIIHKQDELEGMPPVEFPIIVKPVREDASAGIEEDAVVHNLQELTRRVEFILEKFKQPAIVENFIDGRELNVALLGNGEYEALPISEILFSNDRKVCGYRAKWVQDSIEFRETTPLCPAELRMHVQRSVEDTARLAAKLHKCRGYTRIDIRLSREDIPYVIDVNPNPDLSRDAGMVRSANAAGLSYKDMVGKILTLAL